MTLEESFPTAPDLLRVLSRWNRWGDGELASGQRRDVLAEIAPFLDTPEVVALIGPRRAGKTTVLFQLMDELEAAGAPRRALLHLNLEEPALGPSLDVELLEKLYHTYRVEVHPSGRAYLFLDEIQQVPGWERWVRARNESEDVKIFVTGSSAALMAPEMATRLTGRHVTFHVLPLTFRETLRFRGPDVPEVPRLVASSAPLEHALHDYLQWGGFPEIVMAQDKRRREVLLKQYFDDVLFKDVAIRHRIRDLVTLRNLAVYLLGQTASRVSVKRLAQLFGISRDLARTYCGHLEEAFLVSFLSFYTLKTGERLRQPRKVHAVDLGLHNAVCLSGAPDRGRLMESAVHNTLARQAHDGLFYWQGEGEIGLVVRRGLEVEHLIQVTDAGLERPEARAREVGALLEAQERFPEAKASLIAGRLPPNGAATPVDGIELVPLWRFLAEAS